MRVLDWKVIRVEMLLKKRFRLKNTRLMLLKKDFYKYLVYCAIL